MKKSMAKFAVFGFAIVSVALILTLWKNKDQQSALVELEKTYGVKIDYFDDEIHISSQSPHIVDLHDLVDLLERAEKGKEGKPLTPAVLNLTGSPQLSSLSGVNRMPGLRSIICVDCPSLTTVNGVTGLPNLQELILTNNRALTDISAIQMLPSLVTVDLTNCDKVQSINFLNLPSLKNLYLSGCRNLKSLDVSTYIHLEQLYLDGCMLLPEITGLKNLVALTDLDVSNCQDLKHLNGIDHLAELIVFDIRNVELPDFSIVGKLPKLEVLRLGGQGNLTSLEPFSELTSLIEIHIEACPNFQSIKGLPSSVSQYAGFTHCKSLVTLAGLEVASNLTNLDLKSCESLEDISALKVLPNLTQLSLIRCRKIDSIAQLASNPKLGIVTLGGSGVVPAQVAELKVVLKDTEFDFTVLD